MNSMSGIGNRPAAIQFGSRRPPTLETIKEVLTEDEEDEGAAFPASNREDQFPTQMPPSILSQRPLVRTTSQGTNLSMMLPSAQPSSVDEFNRSENRDISLSAMLPSAQRKQEAGQARLRLALQEELDTIRERQQKAQRARLSPAQREARNANRGNVWPDTFTTINISNDQALRIRKQQQEAMQTFLRRAQQELKAIGDNVRPGTPDSVPDLNQQNQPD